MTSMPTLRNIVNDTPADATDVEFNFNTIETHVASELINRSGAVAMVGPLTLPGSPSAANEAANKAYVDSIIPAGMIAPFAGSAAPTGWLLADGSAVSQTTYAALFAVCGTAYNIGGEGAGNFRLPNLKARFPVGRDAGVAPHDTLGETGGSRDSVLIAHSHTVNGHTHAIDHDHGSAVTTNDGNHTHTYGIRTGSNTTPFGTASGVGFSPDSFPDTSLNGSHTHTVDLPNFTGSSGSASPATNSQGAGVGTNENLPPYLTVNYIIKT